MWNLKHKYIYTQHFKWMLSNKEKWLTVSTTGEQTYTIIMQK